MMENKQNSLEESFFYNNLKTLARGCKHKRKVMILLHRSEAAPN